MGTQKNLLDETVLLSTKTQANRRREDILEMYRRLMLRTGGYCWDSADSEKRPVTKDHSRSPDSALIEAKKGYRRVKVFKLLANALI